MKPSEKLTRLLEAEGLTDVLIYSNGRAGRNEKYPWEGSARKDGIAVALYSWDTMTKCGRNGIGISTVGDNWWSMTVYAKERPAGGAS
jgi:hypothetical protein